MFNIKYEYNITLTNKFIFFLQAIFQVVNFYEDVGCPCINQYRKSLKLLTKVEDAIKAQEDKDDKGKGETDDSIVADADDDDEESDDNDDGNLKDCEKVDTDYCFKHIVQTSIEMKKTVSTKGLNTDSHDEL